MIFRIIVAFAFSLQFAAAEQEGVRWATIDPFCGQLISLQPKLFPITSVKVKLYRATAKHLPCCDSAESLGDLRIDAKGNFDLRNLAAGQYWLIAAWEKTEVPVALWSDGKHHFACDERYKNVIEIRPDTKTAELSVVNSTNAKTH